VAEDLMFAEARTVLWVQFKVLRNMYPRRSAAQTIIMLAMGAIWYGLWSAGAVFAGTYIAHTRDVSSLSLFLPWALLFGLLYWQVIPILMLSTGAAIDLKQVLVYPIPKRQLFGLDVLLRLSTAFEMLIVLTGTTIGLLLNPLLPWWAPLGFLPFCAMNLLASVGLRSVLTRLLAQRHVRELTILFLVIAASLPQIIVMSGSHDRVTRLFSSPQSPIWPWAAAGSIAAGQSALFPWLVLLTWTGIAFAFGRWQFERTLRFDRDEAAAPRRKHPAKRGWLDRLYRWPSAVFPDPLAAIVEKEIRFLPRSSRFRLAFIMGFSFGLLIWLPMAMRGAARSGSVMAENYLTFVMIYALLLLAEVTFWNCFGFDRGAVQMYFVAGVPLSTVLVAKNIAAAVVVFLEMTAITAVCLVVRMPMTASKLVESVAVIAVFTLYVLAIGNLGSTRFPRPIDPKQSWRTSSAGRFQALLLLIYPAIAVPLSLAYVARWALESEAAFFGVLAFVAVLGGVVYWIALESSVASLERSREAVVAALSERGGPIAA
jgi:ABC-2 type transport system permease protein